MGNNGIRFLSSVFLALLTLAMLVFAKSGDVRKLMGGGLSLKHQALAVDCKVCHMPWRGVHDEKCRKCHDRIAEHLADSAAEDKHRAVEGVRCRDCHVEHKGPDIRVSFPGSRVCISCHNYSIHPEIKKRPIMKKPEPNRSFPHSIHKAKAPKMNMERCGDCHIDTDGKGTLGYNAAQLLHDCLPCHYNSPTPNVSAVPFHYVNKAPFLHSRHHDLDCMRCHKDILKIPELSDENLPSVKKCMDCHDPQTGTTCIKCHSFHLVAGTKRGAPKAGG